MGQRSDLRTPPAAVLAPEGVQFIKVDAGDWNTCALTASGQAYCWGSNFYGQIGDGGNRGYMVNRDLPTAVIMPEGVEFSQISAGKTATCAIAVSGESYCWGGNDHGQLGVGSITSSNLYQTTPLAVAAPEGVRFKQISINGTSSLIDHVGALSTDGQTYYWGGG